MTLEQDMAGLLDPADDGVRSAVRLAAWSLCAAAISQARRGGHGWTAALGKLTEQKRLPSPAPDFSHLIT